MTVMAKVIVQVCCHLVFCKPISHAGTAGTYDADGEAKSGFGNLAHYGGFTRAQHVRCMVFRTIEDIY